MDGPEDMEAESLAALLSGFQGGLGDLLTELIDPSQMIDNQFTPDALFTIPEPIQRQSSGAEAHYDGQAGSKSIQKRERASSGSSEPSTSYQVAPSEKANKKATPRELSKVLQSKLSLLDQQQAENDMLKARCRILERVRCSMQTMLAAWAYMPSMGVQCHAHTVLSQSQNQIGQPVTLCMQIHSTAPPMSVYYSPAACVRSTQTRTVCAHGSARCDAADQVHVHCMQASSCCFLQILTQHGLRCLQIVASRESEIKMLQELRAYAEQGEASGFRDPIAPLGLTMQVLVIAFKH